MTGRHEVKYVPDSFQLVAGGVKAPRHVGFTVPEYLEARRKQDRNMAWLIAVSILALMMLAIGLVILP